MFDVWLNYADNFYSIFFLFKESWGRRKNNWLQTGDMIFSVVVMLKKKDLGVVGVTQNWGSWKSDSVLN